MSHVYFAIAIAKMTTTIKLSDAINPAGINFFDLAKRTPIMASNAAARPSATTALIFAPCHKPSPHTSNANPKASPEMSDGKLFAFTYPITPPTNTNAPYTITIIAVFCMNAPYSKPREFVQKSG